MELGIEIFMLKLRHIENFTMFVLGLRWPATQGAISQQAYYYLHRSSFTVIGQI
jgi:hypothetical protein